MVKIQFNASSRCKKVKPRQHRDLFKAPLASVPGDCTDGKCIVQGVMLSPYLNQNITRSSFEEVHVCFTLLSLSI